GDDDERGLAARPPVLDPESEVAAVGVDRALLDEDLAREIDLHEVVLEEAEGLDAPRRKRVCVALRGGDGRELLRSRRGRGCGRRRGGGRGQARRKAEARGVRVQVALGRLGGE